MKLVEILEILMIFLNFLSKKCRFLKFLLVNQPNCFNYSIPEAFWSVFKKTGSKKFDPEGYKAIFKIKISIFWCFLAKKAIFKTFHLEIDIIFLIFRFPRLSGEFKKKPRQKILIWKRSWTFFMKKTLKIPKNRVKPQK